MKSISLGIDIFTYGKHIKTRKLHYCHYSGDLIESGSHVMSLKVYPSAWDDLDKPVTLYACLKCGECTH